MEFDPPDRELIVLESSDDDSNHENGDIMILEELYRQEKFIESLQQFTEQELSKLDDSNTEQADIELIHEIVKDSNFSSEKNFSSTLFQESANHESTLQFDEDEFIDLILENDDVMLVENQSFVDCGTIDYNGKLDFEETDEFQMDSILTEYLATVGSSLDPLGDPKLQCQVTVSLERLPESITKVKDTSEVITHQKLKLKDAKKSVQLYCHKCEKFEISNVKVSMPKNCQDCGNLLIYLCTKCKEKYFTTYTAMKLHGKICKSKKTTVEVPTSLFVYDCQDCDFRTLNKNSVDRHVKKTKHRLNDVDGNLRADKNEDVKYTRQLEKDCSKAFKRFCKKCNKIPSSMSTADDKLCKKCDTPLFYRCIKCNVTSKSYKSLVYHLTNKCLTKIYKCCKCDFITVKWKLIQRHMKKQHQPRINYVNCEYCNFECDRKNNLIRHLAVKHNVGFCCKLCNRYTTTIADRLQKHIFRRHSQTMSETFECPICRRYSTNNRNDLWKHIDRRHS